MDNQKYLEKAAVMFVDGRYHTFIELAADLLKNIEKLEEEKKGLVVPMGEEELFVAIRAVACDGTTDCENHPKCPTEYGCLPDKIAKALLGKVGRPGGRGSSGGVLPKVFFSKETRLPRRELERLLKDQKPGTIVYIAPLEARMHCDPKRLADLINSYITKSGNTFRRVIKRLSRVKKVILLVVASGLMFLAAGAALSEGNSGAKGDWHLEKATQASWSWEEKSAETQVAIAYYLRDIRDILAKEVK